MDQLLYDSQLTPNFRFANAFADTRSLSASCSSDFFSWHDAVERQATNTLRSPTVYDQSNISPRFPNSEPALLDLRHEYINSGDEETLREVLEEVPPLFDLLKQAPKFIRAEFGSNFLLRLDTLKSDEDVTLRVVVKLPSGFDTPSEKMRLFKQNWWLKNSYRAHASLVFDYELRYEL